MGRGDFSTKIGVGQVIKGKNHYHCREGRGEWLTVSMVGWDDGVLSTDGGMSLGEKATLTITG